MKKVYILKCLLLPVVLLLPVCGGARADSLVDSLRSRYIRLLLPAAQATADTLLQDLLRLPQEAVVSDQNVEELHLKYPVSAAEIDATLALMRPDGSWTDINYADTKRSGWEPKVHARRVLDMAKYLRSEELPAARRAQVEKAVHQALRYWFTAKPVCRNWWYNQIGLPKMLGEAFLLLWSELDEDERAGAIEVMKKARIGMTGQNKVWLAGNVLLRGLLEGDAGLVREARDAIAGEITLGRAEGIKDDWSFHQHGPQQQFGNYGLAYLNSMSFYAALFEGTSVAFDDRHRGILSSFVNEGYRWILWHREMDVNGLNRQLFHNAAIHKGYLTAMAAQNLGLSGFPLKGNPLVGHKHFFCSDYTLHRRPRWMASLRMSSSRVIGTELVNEDNLKGFYMGDGAIYYYVDGREYLNIFPLWDWRKLPGVTAYEDTVSMMQVSRRTVRNATPQVGGITCGSQGLSAMRLQRDGLSAVKAWLFTDRFVLCLGAGIRTDSALTVTTAVDQRWQRGPLEVWKGGRWQQAAQVSGRLRRPCRLFHDQTGYVLLDGRSFEAKAERRSGRWDEVMGMYPSDPVQGDVLSVCIGHGASPKGETYAYLVFPAATREEVAQFSEREVRLLRNDAEAQVVALASEPGKYWAAVYAPVTLRQGKARLRIEAPGLYRLEQSGDSFRVLQQSLF